MGNWFELFWAGNCIAHQAREKFDLVAIRVDQTQNKPNITWYIFVIGANECCVAPTEGSKGKHERFIEFEKIYEAPELVVGRC